MKNRAFKFVTILSLAAILSLSGLLAGCKKNEKPVEVPYKGTLGAIEYDSEEEAARGFFEFEIGGMPNIEDVVNWVGYESKGELSESESRELELSDKERGNVASVTKVEVTCEYPYEIDLTYDNEYLYPFPNGYFTIPEEISGESFTNGAYVIKYNSGKYKYYAPIPKTGELITKSYLRNIVRGDKYINYSSKTEYDGVEEAFSETKITSSVLYIKNRMSYSGSEGEVLWDDSALCIIKTGKGFYEAYANGL